MSLHILPADDNLDHSRTDDCVCGPSMKRRPDGRAGWAIVHNPLDGREQHEEG